MKINIYQPNTIFELGSRSNQEDCIVPLHGTSTATHRVFILCDGMGGHERGEVASQTVCQTLCELLTPVVEADEILTDEYLNDAVNKAVAKLNGKDGTTEKKMGTTLTLLVFHKGGCTAAHIGDSRIYHLRPQTNEILYKSRDHSLVYELFQCGEITFDEMKTSSRRNIITRAIQAGLSPDDVHADIVHITDIRAGDYFYLCSDGMLENMDDDDILATFSADGSNREKVDSLVRRTMHNKDNHSAIVVQVEEILSGTLYESFCDNESIVPFNAVYLDRKRKAETQNSVVNVEVDQSDVHNVTIFPATVESVDSSISKGKESEKTKWDILKDKEGRHNGRAKKLIYMVLVCFLGIIAVLLYMVFLKKENAVPASLTPIGRPQPKYKTKSIEKVISDHKSKTLEKAAEEKNEVKKQSATSKDSTVSVSADIKDSAPHSTVEPKSTKVPLQQPKVREDNNNDQRNSQTELGEDKHPSSISL